MALDPNFMSMEEFDKEEAAGNVVPTENTTPSNPGASGPSNPFPADRTNVYFDGSMPPQFQLDSSFSRGRVLSGRVPTGALMPFGPNANPSTNAAIQSTATKVVEAFPASSGNATLFQGVPIKSGPKNQDVYQFNGSDFELVLLDGGEHGDPFDWWSDPGFVFLRDEFMGGAYNARFGSGSAAMSFGNGELGWATLGNLSAEHDAGYNPPHCGVKTFYTVQNAGAYMLMLLNEIAVDTNSASFGNYAKSMALLENPGWKMSWVFQFRDNFNNGTTFTADFRKKALYLGLFGAPIACFVPGSSTFDATASTSPTSCRPDYFIGLRYDCSHVVPSWGVSSVAAAAGGTTVYTMNTTASFGNYSSPAGTWKNATVICSGFQNAANNGTFTVNTSAAGTITLNNPSGVVETGGPFCSIRLTNVNITAVTQNSPASGQATYTFPTVNQCGLWTINGSLIGQTVVISGCTNAGNNGTFTVIGSTATTLIVANSGAVTETPVANTAFSAFSDANSPNDQGGNFKFEVVQNNQYGNGSGGAMHSLPGTVFDTGITPQLNNWYRLDLTCTTAGQVTLTLTDENNAVQSTHTFTVPQVSIGTSNMTFSTGATNANSIATGRVQFTDSPSTATSGVPTIPAPPFGPGSLVAFSNFTGGVGTALNGKSFLLSEVEYSSGITSITFGFYPGTPLNASSAGTLTGYSTYGPGVLWGTDNSGVTTLFTGITGLALDFFSFFWNQAATTPSVSPNPLKSRYW